jgi:hypothetical protein
MNLRNAYPVVCIAAIAAALLTLHAAEDPGTFGDPFTGVTSSTLQAIHVSAALEAVHRPVPGRTMPRRGIGVENTIDVRVSP